MLKTWRALWGSVVLSSGSSTRYLVPKLEKSFIMSLPCAGLRAACQVQHTHQLWMKLSFQLLYCVSCNGMIAETQIFKKCPKFVFPVNGRWALCICVWCWVRVFCVWHLSTLRGGPHNSHLRTALPSLRVPFRVASNLPEDGRDRLDLHPVDSADGRRTIGISWGDRQEQSGKPASPLSCADAMGC